MQDQPNPYLQTIFQKYGQRWDPSLLAQQQGENSPAAFAVGIAQYATNIMQGVTRSCPGFEVDVFFVENLSINAFAGKISDSREHYAVGVYSGTITKLFQAFTSAKYLATLKSNLTFLGTFADFELQQLSLYFGSLFLIFHEFGHVIRGHINYARSTTAMDGLWMEGNEDESAASPEITRRRHLSECDADAFAGTLLAGEISVHAGNLGRDLRIDTQVAWSDLIALEATAVHFLCCLFDDARKNAHPFYPPPPIRSAIVQSHVVDQAGRDGQNAWSVLINLIPVLARVEALRHELGLKQGAYDLKTAFETWRTQYLDQLKKFKATLGPYAPCQPVGKG